MRKSDYIPNGIKLMVIITRGGKGMKLISLLKNYGVYYCNDGRGRGTANKEVLDFLGIGDTEKDLIFALLDEDRIKEVFEFFKNDTEFVGGRKGVAFTVSLDSITSMKAIAEICRKETN